MGTIWRALSKPPQRRHGPDLCPLWLLVGTPSAIIPELAAVWAGSTVPREGFYSSVIMFFSWCAVAVALPIYCRSTSIVKPPYIPSVVSRAFMTWCSIVGAIVTVHQFFCILQWIMHKNMTFSSHFSSKWSSTPKSCVIFTNNWYDALTKNPIFSLLCIALDYINTCTTEVL